MLEEIFFLQNQTNILFITIFLGWSSINVLGSLFAFLVNRQQSEIKHFLRMNVFLGIASNILGGIIYYILRSNGRSMPSKQQILEASIAMENLLIFGAGIAAVIFVIGLFIFLKDSLSQPDIYKGFGLAMIVQAIFAFLLMLASYISNQIYTNELIKIIISGI